ncbi:hypothetical protein SK128_003453 [Halocaridina rubra]|uniref:Uncharacterized protein n=1 Tax=Halocaridina rubra TaxID=373956 RepID=A0AAN9AF26_HALRR
MKFLVFMFLAVAACVAEVKEPEAEIGYSVSQNGNYPVKSGHGPGHYYKRSTYSVQGSGSAHAYGHTFGYHTHSPSSYGHHPSTYGYHHYHKRSAAFQPKTDTYLYGHSRGYQNHYATSTANAEQLAVIHHGYVSPHDYQSSYPSNYGYHHYHKRSANPEPVDTYYSYGQSHTYPSYYPQSYEYYHYH